MASSINRALDGTADGRVCFGFFSLDGTADGRVCFGFFFVAAAGFFMARRLAGRFILEAMSDVSSDAVTSCYKWHI